MGEGKKHRTAHCIVLTYPTQGHINPLLQFSKRLQHKGVKVTLVATRFIANTILKHKTSSPPSSDIQLESISDGFDQGGIAEAESTQVYLERFREMGTQNLISLVDKLNRSAPSCPVRCIIYDAFLPWCLDVAKKLGLVAAPFFTQSCAVDSIYYHVQKGLIQVPVPEEEILLPKLPPLQPQDLPSFIYKFGIYPDVFDLVVTSQFFNIDKADWVLCNTVYELEQELADWLSKLWPLKTIGPTIPSMYLDKQLEDDKVYGFSLFKPNNEACMKWLEEKPKGSVVYVSFGSLAELSVEQMEELCWGLKGSNYHFLWVVRTTEEAKLPKNFREDSKEKGLVVSWCHQLEVLTHEAVGCFLTHCGWNSTLEALSLGVPMVAMPQWTDQTTNAKFIMDVWKMGIRAPADDKEIVRRGSVEHCIREIMEGERGEEIKLNASKWRKLFKDAMSRGGSSDKNIDEFVESLVRSS